MTSVFKIGILELDDGYHVQAEFNGKRAGERLGVLPDDFESRLEPLQEEILRTSETVRELADYAAPSGGAASDADAHNGHSIATNRVIRGLQQFRRGADVKLIQEVGGDLYRAVFHRKVYALFDRAYNDALACRTEIPIRLCIETPKLSHYPWETMFDVDEESHLSCGSWTPFSRAVSMEEDELKFALKPPLRLLLMVASPKEKDLNAIDAEREQKAIQIALQPLVDRRLIKIGKTCAGTLDALRQQIEAGDEGASWDVVHFIGHGMEGSVAFEGNGRPEAEWVSADDLRDELSAPRGPQLVVLNSCKGAVRAPGDRFSSTAETLVKGGQILASIAMQFEISDKMAVQFSPLFYKQLLAEKKTLRKAMLVTRRELRRKGFAEWITPVLYLRGADAALFAGDE
jgi:CHAT domain